MKKIPLNFSTALVVLGCAMAMAVAFDLAARGLHRLPAPPRVTLPEEADAERGRAAIVRYGCGACHVVPGIRRATGRVGPKLEELGDQMYLGGVLPNTPENLARWIQDPPHFSPRTAMPDLGVSQQEAEDMAAFLYTDR